MNRRHLATIALATALPAARATAQSASLTTAQQLGRAVLRELIETNTTRSSGGTGAAPNKMAARFLAAGFAKGDVVVAGPNPRDMNLVVRYRGRGGSARKPILLLAHLDVVEAKRADWTFDPFVLTEQGGYFYGRGTLDVKGGAATLVTALVRLKQEGFVPERDIILALTAGEEDGVDNGVQWLLANRRAPGVLWAYDAEYCINLDAGGGEYKNGRVRSMDVQASEKVYLTFAFTARNPGGHSSLPTRDNAIYHVAGALDRLSRYTFPARLNDITREYFKRTAELPGEKHAADMHAVAATPPDTAGIARLSAASPFYNAMLRTTCVATQMEAGHAENALPQSARATVNCRLLPDEDTAFVRKTLVRIAADTQVAIAPVAPAVLSPPSPLTPALFQAIDRITKALWGNIPIVPVMETGATDGLFLRNAGMPVYGVTGIYNDPDDVRAHGKDERILVKAYYDGIEFIYRLVKAVGGA